MKPQLPSRIKMASSRFRLSATQIQIGQDVKNQGSQQVVHWFQYSMSILNQSAELRLQLLIHHQKVNSCNDSGSCRITSHQELHSGIQLSHFVIRGQHHHSDRFISKTTNGFKLGHFTSFKEHPAEVPLDSRRGQGRQIGAQEGWNSCESIMFSQNMFQLQKSSRSIPKVQQQNKFSIHFKRSQPPL